MAKSTLIRDIANKGIDKEKIAARVIRKPELLSELFDGLGADAAAVKFGCDKVVRIISEKKPELLYPHWKLFVQSLSSDNSFLAWGAIFVISNLAAVDTKRRFERIFDQYFAPIPGPVLIAAANTVGGAARIALAKPKLADRIAKELLKVEQAKYKTVECRNIALGHAITSFDRFIDLIENKKPVLAMVRRQLENTRPATRKKAEKFLKKHGHRP